MQTMRALPTLLLGSLLLLGACGDDGPPPVVEPRVPYQQVQGSDTARDFSRGTTSGGGARDFGQGKAEGSAANFSVGNTGAATSGPTGSGCPEACSVLLGCGYVINDCVPSCEAGGIPTSTLSCIAAADCATVQGCF
jgi:hypothetical protein